MIYSLRKQFKESPKWRLKDPIGNSVQLLVGVVCIVICLLGATDGIGSVIGDVAGCVWMFFVIALMAIIYNRMILAIKFDNEKVFIWRNRLWEEVELGSESSLKTVTYINGIVRLTFRTKIANKRRSQTFLAWPNFGPLEREEAIKKIEEEFAINAKSN